MRPLLLAIFLLLSWSHPLSAADLSKHLPGDATWVVGLEVPRFLQSPVVHDCLPALLRSQGPAAVAALLNGRLAEDAGLVKRLIPHFAAPDAALTALGRRVARVFIAGTGNRAQSSLFLIAQGRISAADVATCVKRTAPVLWPHGIVETIRLAKHDVWRVSPPGDDEVLYVALLEPGTVVATTNKAALTRMLNQGERGRTGPPADLVELARTIDAGKTPLWMVGAPRPTDGLAPYRGGVDFTNGLHGQWTFTPRTRDDVQELASDLGEFQEELIDVARDLHPRSRLGSGLVKVMQAITIKRGDKQVEMQLERRADELKREWVK